MTKSIQWTVDHKTSSDGLQNFMTINSQWPAEAITVRVCTEISLTVINNAEEDLTLHFHGLLQSNGSTISDGAQGLSQSAIPNSKSYTYVVMADKSGTYWIHSHSPGQYPKGVRAPLIVTDDTLDKQRYGYNTDEVMTVSDWWQDFGYAETRAKAKSDLSCGENQKGKNTFGLEYPSQRVLVNDINASHNTTIGKPNKTYKIGNCNTDKKRLRIVNLSSHARFYIFFSDHRNFDVIEYDGILYPKQQTQFLGLASGQRASILFDGKSSTQSGQCQNAYIIAASDTKVSHGTNLCKMDFTRPDRGVQYAHAYVEVNGNPIANSARDLGRDDFPESDLIVYSNWSPNDPNRDMNFQTYPSGSWKATEAVGNDALTSARQAAAGIMNNRLDLPYRVMWYRNDHDTDYGATKGGSRIIPGILGIGNAEELQMSPVDVIPAWDVPASSPADYMHYITLGGVDAADNDGYGGFASMGEYVGKTSDGGTANKLVPWQDPEGDYSLQKTKLNFPSAFRALESGLSDTELNQMARYQQQGSANGRTILFKDDKPNWLVLRSVLGDHPMHLHGHHFQILAKLPNKWFDNSATALYNHLVNEGATMGKANRINPPRRDTVMIEKGLTYVIAVNADNPGVWAFHCHNDIHAVTGMFSQVVEQPKALRDKVGTWKNYGGSPLKFDFVPGNNPSLTDKFIKNFKNSMSRYGYLDSEWSIPIVPSRTQKSKRRTNKKQRLVEAQEGAALEKREVEKLSDSDVSLRLYREA